MGTPTSGGRRHRRRIRIALPVAAAGLAAAVAGVFVTTPAGAATTAPTPVHSTPSTSAIEARLATALAGDDTAGETSKSSLSASRSSGSASVDPKIIGGSTTTITTAPYMAQLWYGDDRGTSTTSDDIGFFCGGAVVAPTKILTAAHCVAGYDWKAHGAVITGTAQLLSETASGGIDLHGGTASGVWRQWNNPSYDDYTIDNDLAVLTLPNPVKATPIPMTTAGDTASYTAGTTAQVFGWGRTSSTSEDISDTLKTAELPIQSNATCSGEYGSDFIAGHMVCAGEPATGSDAGTTSACNGDSGGPLVVGGKVVGVVSWGVKDCVAAGAYSVFTKLTTYVAAAHPRVDDTNLSGDHRADLFVRNSSTKTGYEIDSKGTTLASRQSWGSYSAWNLVLQTDLDRDGYTDFVQRRASDGDLYWRHYVLSSGTWTSNLIGDNWKSRLAVVAPGDVTGDELPDLLSVDSAGVLWIYPGKGNGKFATRVKVSTGWNQYNVVRGHGDLTNDGRADLLARNKSTGAVYLYKGTGKAGTAAFSARVKVLTWSNTTYNAFDAVGDVNADGKADFLARTPGGTLYLYKGTGKATSEIFATRVSLGTSFKQYDLFG
ncbi:trypsin-like serine protease [Streptomyces sp. NBC_00582]|uniref:trypsin-like serine protease n=1 Tax=Streptomyces sp. NBC_00582 TaxID=2975783 RepID=UPI002E818969|nr:trypsin-like serine protease [Streptomyces sp. NBC_00582]WUB61947.1 trypsin-like serine protease [Streptomyces sp. NBC_00582]